MFNIYRKIKYNFDSSLNHGFTLVELMVVISIFLVMVGVMIFDYGSFRSNVSLQNLTDDIALSIRKAQGFAIGARGVGDGVKDFKKSYGMHFSTNSNLSQPLDGSSKSFLMFSTPSNNKIYITGTGVCGDSTNNDCIEAFNIISSDIIKDIILNMNDNSILHGGYLDIIFTRPDSRAYFCYRSSINNNSCDKTNISNVSIVISNGDTDQAKVKTRTISVQNTGQISIK